MSVQRTHPALLVQAANQNCHSPKATRGNITVTLSLAPTP